MFLPFSLGLQINESAVIAESVWRAMAIGASM